MTRRFTAVSCTIKNHITFELREAGNRSSPRKRGRAGTPGCVVLTGRSFSSPAAPLMRSGPTTRLSRAPEITGGWARRLGATHALLHHPGKGVRFFWCINQQEAEIAEPSQMPTYPQVPPA